MSPLLERVLLTSGLEPLLNVILSFSVCRFGLKCPFPDSACYLQIFGLQLKIQIKHGPKCLKIPNFSRYNCINLNSKIRSQFSTSLSLPRPAGLSVGYQSIKSAKAVFTRKRMFLYSKDLFYTNRLISC